MIPEIHIEDFNYDLPDDRIAKYPLPRRDSSKLLIYRDGAVRETVFSALPEELPADSMMIFNDTRVVPARLFFRRDTGAHIEIFCLSPVLPAEYASAFAQTGTCRWKCVIGNSKRWKGDILNCEVGDDAELAAMKLRASLVSLDAQTGVVEFTWEGGAPFSRVLELCGKVPIPPYLNRETEAIDAERYQTTYAHIHGSVAAPTAGLHFTDGVMARIRERGIEMQNVCLHVGAGTFLPVKSSLVSEHPMHREPFVIGRDLLRRLADGDRSVTAVGTTSVRTLESLYYVGIQCLEHAGEPGWAPGDVPQWVPYERDYDESTSSALGAIIDWMDASGLDELKLGTRIIIVPGFRFRIVDRMVTNFHQPQSTLLLLVSAFTGGDWRTIYDYALDHGVRFLSYGDSSLLFRK